MHSFPCALWTNIWSFPFLFFVRQPAVFPITQAEMPQKLIPNQHTINSKQFLRESSEFPTDVPLPFSHPKNMLVSHLVYRKFSVHSVGNHGSARRIFAIAERRTV